MCRHTHILQGESMWRLQCPDKALFSFFLSSSYVCAICSHQCGSSPSNMRRRTRRTELLSGGISPSDYKGTQGRLGFQWSWGNGFKAVWVQQLLCPASSATWLSSGYGMVQGWALKPLHFSASLFFPQLGLKFANTPKAATCCWKTERLHLLVGYHEHESCSSLLPCSGWELPKETPCLQQTDPACKLCWDPCRCQRALESLITCFIYHCLSFSQYPNLWSVSNGSITPVSQSSGMSNGLSSQFLCGSPAHYTALPHQVTAASSASPLYDGGAPTDLPDSQYDASSHTRLASTWTPVTPPSM